MQRGKGGTLMKIEDAIAQYPGVQGGYPVITGTRTPIRTIVELYYDIYPYDIDEVHRSLEHLTIEQIRAALAYYDEQPELVDEDIARQREAFLKIRIVNVRDLAK
jgi:uncharacterized protein (DUF433 family)